MTPKLPLLALVLFCGAPLVTPAPAQNTTKGITSYSGDLGPGFWGKIAETCAPSSTARQSPINITRVVEDDKLEPLNLILPRTGVALTNTGDTIMGATGPGGALVIDGLTYSLAQFHFHTLSEHTVEGQRGAMELHVVFKNSHGDYAVIGVLYRVGRPNGFLEKLIAAGLPSQTSSPPVRLQEVNIRTALTDTASYYTYPGSLTTPNCDPKVKWLVLKRWAQLSPEQFQAFRTILGNNFRPLQERNGRVIQATVGRGGDDSAPVAESDR